MNFSPLEEEKVRMTERHILRLNNCVTIVVWLKTLDPIRFHPHREASTIIITIPSRLGLTAYRVTSHRPGSGFNHPSMWRISWVDPDEPPENFPVSSDRFLGRVDAFRRRMWGNREGYYRTRSNIARWLLDILRRELEHDFFDHDRLRLVMGILSSLLHSD